MINNKIIPVLTIALLLTFSENKHTIDIKERDLVALNIDLINLGVS